MTRAACAILALLALAACSGNRPPPPGSGGDRGLPAGLEITWWVVDDSLQPAKEPLPQVLRDYEARPLPGAGRELWKANGLRVVPVPLPELDLVRARLATAGPLHEQWLGILPDWTPLIAGPDFAEPVRLQLDSGSLDLPPGRLRLLARAWATPVEPESAPPAGGPAAPADGRLPAALRVEVLPQHAQAAPSDPLRRALGAPAPGILDQGQTFPRLTLALLARGKQAFLIVPADPAEDWAGAEGAGGEAGRPASSTADAPLAPLPAPVPAPTFGQAMLSDAAHPFRRAVLVLIPHAPAHFEIGR